MNSSTPDALIYDLLKTHWGYHEFRPLQEKIIRSVLASKDTVAILPTGGGKSLCYQLPTLADKGLCLVISPLIALMKDQVENLRKKNITAYAIYSGMSRKEIVHIFSTVSESNCRFLYVSPERLETNLFKEYLPGLPISLIAVDEAHCISQWGYDFRPSYLRIADLRKEVPDIPVLALTASATKEVQQDIIEKLELDEVEVFRNSTARINLSFSVFKTDSRINKIKEILQNVSGSALVYCSSRKRTKEISEVLNLHHINCDYYHAGLTTEDRNRKQENWLKGKTRVMACTNAFGMGIDKANVRVVVHADPPDSVENYYQEAGRAGRDGHRSYAVLLYDEQDITSLQEIPLIRYPDIKTIQEIYQSVCNYLQIAPGMGLGEYYDFDLSDFLKKFQLNSQEVLYSLKALEQDGWISFNESFFQPSQIVFMIGKNELYRFEKEYPEFELMIKSLLRAYEGVFDYPAFISEWHLLQLTKKSVEEINQQLIQLHHRGVIEYKPRKDTPQLYWMRSRVPSSELRIDQKKYHQRKEKTITRIDQLIQYIQNENKCRSLLIGKYFGDQDITECGICDNCLVKKRKSITRDEFDKASQLITHQLEKGDTQISELVKQISFINKEKAWEVINFLQAEHKIEVSETGYARLL